MKARWLLIALVASLALNLALVGYMVGKAAGPPFLRPPPTSFDPTVGLGRLLRFLPAERRREVLAGTARQDIRESLVTARRTARTLHQQLGQEPFDEQALATTLQRFRNDFAESQARSHAAFVAATAALTPAERQRFTKSLRKEARRGGDGVRKRERRSESRGDGRSEDGRQE